MPTLGGPLDFVKYEGRNFRAHQLGAAPSSPVTGQIYYDTVGNALYFWNGTTWVSASGGTPADATTSTRESSSSPATWPAPLPHRRSPPV